MMFAVGEIAPSGNFEVKAALQGGTVPKPTAAGFPASAATIWYQYGNGHAP